MEAVLEGGFLRVNGGVRLSARLLDVAKGTTLWAQRWDLRGATSSRCRTDWRPKSAGRWLFAW